MTKKNGLSSMWGLTAPKKGSKDNQAALFRTDFATVTRELSGSIDAATRHGPKDECSELWDDRDQLFTDYQKIKKTIDPKDPTKAEEEIEEFLLTIDDLIEQAQKINKDAEALFKSWGRFSGQFERQGERIDILDEESFADAAKLLLHRAEIAEMLEEHRWADAEGEVGKLAAALGPAEVAHDAAKALAAAAAPVDDDEEEDDEEEIVMLEDDRTERKAKRKFKKLFPKVDKGANRVIALVELSEELTEKQTEIKDSHEEAVKLSTDGSYYQAYETAFFLKHSLEKFSGPYKAWAKAKKHSLALAPKVAEATARVEAIDPFNRELETELAHLAEIKELHVPLIAAFDFVPAEVILVDLKGRLKHLAKRDGELDDQRAVMQGLKDISARMQAVLNHPPLAALAAAQDAVRAAHEKLETAVLGELFEIALKELEVLEENILTFELAKDEFDTATWHNRDGEVIGTIGEPGFIESPRISPDETHVALEYLHDGGQEIRNYELRRGISTSVHKSPVKWRQMWSPDGREILFALQTEPRKSDIVAVNADGTGGVRTLVKGEHYATPHSLSRDGRWLVFASDSADDPTYDLWIEDLENPGQPRRLVDSARGINETNARISPDDRWVAYTTDESGRNEVYVVNVESGKRIRVSPSGGFQPRWRGDQRELFYITSADEIVAASVDVEGDELIFGEPRVLFKATLLGHNDLYDVSSDGQRFLILTGEQHRPTSATILLNWFEKPANE